MVHLGCHSDLCGNLSHTETHNPKNLTCPCLIYTSSNRKQQYLTGSFPG